MKPPESAVQGTVGSRRLVARTCHRLQQKRQVTPHSALQFYKTEIKLPHTYYRRRDGARLREKGQRNAILGVASSYFTLGTRNR